MQLVLWSQFAEQFLLVWYQNLCFHYFLWSFYHNLLYFCWYFFSYYWSLYPDSLQKSPPKLHLFWLDHLLWHRRQLLSLLWQNRVSESLQIESFQRDWGFGWYLTFLPYIHYSYTWFQSFSLKIFGWEKILLPQSLSILPSSIVCVTRASEMHFWLV